MNVSTRIYRKLHLGIAWERTVWEGLTLFGEWWWTTWMLVGSHDILVEGYVRTVHQKKPRLRQQKDIIVVRQKEVLTSAEWRRIVSLTTLVTNSLCCFCNFLPEKWKTLYIYSYIRGSAILLAKYAFFTDALTSCSISLEKFSHHLVVSVCFWLLIKSKYDKYELCILLFTLLMSSSDVSV